MTTAQDRPLDPQGRLSPLPDEIEALDLPVVDTLPPELVGRHLRTGPNQLIPITTTRDGTASDLLVLDATDVGGAPLARGDAPPLPRGDQPASTAPGSPTPTTRSEPPPPAPPSRTGNHMTEATPTSSPPERREFDIVVLGATGLTGRLVVQQLIDTDREHPDTAGRWAVAGRNHDRLSAVLAERGAPQVAAIVADTTSPPSLAAMAARTSVVLNLAGPYTPTAETVIEACVDAGTAYADLSGELPLMQRVNRRFHERARRAGVQVVQMAGWEALPADLVTMVASHQAAADIDIGRWGPDGPGAADPIRRVDITARFTQRPEGELPPGQSVSAGTLASIVAILEDPGARIVGDPAGLLPDQRSARAVRSASPLRLRPRFRHDRLLGSFVPVAFLDPPVLHRTAALLAEERRAAHRPATIQESLDLGGKDAPGATARLASAAAQAAVQRVLIGVAHLPGTVRRAATRLARTRLPGAGTGPSGRHLHDWAWTVSGEAVTTTGSATATLEGRGHPGYTATAAMIVVVGRHLAGTDRGDLRTGCLTPALALGVRGARELSAPGLRMRTEVVGPA